jgi:hypothetical protein
MSERRSTLNDSRPAAVICRERGWTAGTRLIGDAGDGLTVIEITAIGELGILAKTITHAGEPEMKLIESAWRLEFRDWRTVADAPAKSSCPKCNLRAGQTCGDQACPGLQRRSPPPGSQPAPQPIGCICPPTAEQTCMVLLCPRQNRLGKAFAR